MSAMNSYPFITATVQVLHADEKTKNTVIKFMKKSNSRNRKDNNNFPPKEIKKKIDSSNFFPTVNILTEEREQFPVPPRNSLKHREIDSWLTKFQRNGRLSFGTWP